MRKTLLKKGDVPSICLRRCLRYYYTAGINGGANKLVVERGTATKKSMNHSSN